MAENDKLINKTGGQDQAGCDCNGNCCPPKKTNKPRMIIFILILLAAIAVIGFKIANKPTQAEVKESCCPPQFTTGYDTTGKLSCDTAKGSSCCPK